LGELLPPKVYWKSVVRDAHEADLLKIFFNELHQLNSVCVNIVITYDENSKVFCQILVDTNVAESKEDVIPFMEIDFFHAYGPINEYF
jgi:hypothetical protein